ncbi:hypothetical protein NL676_029311 [Syzygium grande]|nr:hypothetical protein NL676_029311 [Syzygium grande]
MVTIQSFDRPVDAVIEHYSIVRENNQGLPCFLLGQSMGEQLLWRCFAGDMLPPWPVKQILIGVAKILPKGIRQRWDLETQSRKNRLNTSFSDCQLGAKRWQFL